MGPSIAEFLTATGGTGLLVALYDTDRTFSELLECVDATSSTLSTRLTDAEDLGLITTETGERDGNRATEYQLTGFGYVLTMQLDRHGVVEHYRQLMYHRTGVEEGLSRVVEWVEENEQQILAHQSELEKSGREYFEELREQASDSDTDRDIDKYLVSETVYSPSESDGDEESSSDDAAADTENTSDDGTEADDGGREEITDYWGSLDPDTGSTSDDDSELDSSKD